jgi:recombination protein RecT
MSTEPSQSTAVATAKKPTQLDVFHSQLTKYEGDIKALLAIYNMDPNKFITMTLNAVKRTPKLLECDPKTLFASIMVSAELGLEPNTLMGYAHILPFKRKFKEGSQWKEVLEAQFQLGYPGWLEIMYRNPKIESIDTGAIYENEEWTFDKGKREPFSHKPLPPSKRGKEWVAIFAIAWLRDSVKPKVIVLYKEEIDQIKKLSQGANSEYSPWNSSEKDPFLWMPRKTGIKQLVKELPKTKEIEKVYHIDNVVETGGTIRLNEDNTIEAVESDYAKALPNTMRKENKESAVAGAMGDIAKEVKKEDASHVPPEDVS